MRKYTTMKEFAEYVKNLPEIKWIDGEDADKNEPLPMFYVGDTVVLYNPYEGAFIISEFFAIEPTKYRVIESKYDDEEEVFRYRLERRDGEDDDYVEPDEWYSEEWLSLPTVTTYVRTLGNSEENNPKEELEMKMTDIEGEILAKSIVEELDAELRKREIDRFLDLLRTGNAEERKAAEKELRRITTEGSR